MSKRAGEKGLTKVQREVIAWEKWLAGDIGQSCSASLPAHTQYLKNRLWHAFFAGVKAGRAALKAEVER